MSLRHRWRRWRASWRRAPRGPDSPCRPEVDRAATRAAQVEAITARERNRARLSTALAEIASLRAHRTENHFAELIEAIYARGGAR